MAAQDSVSLSLMTSFNNRLTAALTSPGTSNRVGKPYKVMTLITTAKSIFFAPFFHTLWFANLHDSFSTHLLLTVSSRMPKQKRMVLAEKTFFRPREGHPNCATFFKSAVGSHLKSSELR
ncbi:hypothetical protein HanIR_Chr13g0620121 [Helianthus annuus]|nr:hypothetical protein HanIR_Chr13g0620121 [Helianthus annuus]